MRETKFQKFSMTRVNRDQLIDAPYNPRQIDDGARKKLRANLQRVGLVAPIVWNKTTGHIVSGHQRLTAMDSLERRTDYELDVAVVELDEVTEKEQNIFLNNELAMGNFDIPKLDLLIQDVDFKNTGFEESDLRVMLPSWQNRPAARLAIPTFDPGAVVQPTETRSKPNPGPPRVNLPEENETYTVLVFRDRTKTDEFLDRIQVDNCEKYLSGEMLLDRLNRVKGGA